MDEGQIATKKHPDMYSNEYATNEYATGGLKRRSLSTIPT